MSATIFLVGIAILFTIFLVNLSWKATKENHQEKTLHITDEIEKGKYELRLLKNAATQFDGNEGEIKQSLLNIRLELFHTKDDLNELLDQLSN